MSRDFSFNVYTKLLITLLRARYAPITFSDFLINQDDCERYVILRHDVDKKIKNALRMAEIEHKLNVKSTYYFRYSKRIFDEIIIKAIKNLGHEIGYHYETLAKAKGNFSKAINIFEFELIKFKEIIDVRTICAHGSPLSKWDSRKLWKKYSFEDFRILGEPFFSVDFNEVLYLTDTGRRWNGDRTNLRDKVNSKFSYNFKSTFEILNALNKNGLPDKLMINVHPQRWDDKLLSWLIELIWQNIKNAAKQVLVKVNR